MKLNKIHDLFHKHVYHKAFENSWLYYCHCGDWFGLYKDSQPTKMNPITYKDIYNRRIDVDAVINILGDGPSEITESFKKYIKKIRRKHE